MKRLVSLVTGFLIISSVFASTCFAAWDNTTPADDELEMDVPGLIRQNWDAIQLGTDPALQVTNAKVAPSADIVDTKLHQISTAGKVNGTALISLASIPSGAGVIPAANVPTINTLLPSQTTHSGKALITSGTSCSWGYPQDINISSQATGDLLWYDGAHWARFAPGTSGYVLKSGGAGAAPDWTNTIDASFIGSGVIAPGRLGNGTANNTTFLRGDQTYAAMPAAGIPSNITVFASSGTWVKPGTVSTVYVKVWGGGGGGGGSGTGGGGGGGGGAGYSEGLVGVTENVTVVVGAGGTGGAQNTGSPGGVSYFAGVSNLSANGGSAGTRGVYGFGGSGGTSAGGTINLYGSSGGGCSGNQSEGGTGGSSPMGGGGGGGVPTNNDSLQQGAAGATPGGGGGGSMWNTPGNGGNGGGGLVIVYY